MESILTSIKKLIGITEEYTQFDVDIMIHINSAFGILRQLGVGPADGLRISGKEDTWDQFLQDKKKLELVKTYVYLKVKILFDPPLSSAVMDCINREISQCEWRLMVTAESE